MADLEFRVSIPTDEGFIGRECSNPDCLRYFRVHVESVADEMRCPYCAQRFANSELFTGDQADFLMESAAEQAMEHISREFGKMFGRLQQENRQNKYVTFKSGQPYAAKPVSPGYAERKVDSEIVCPACGSRFQVDGIFAYCVGCGSETIAIYDANLEVIRAEVESGGNSQRVLRHAYNDLVATFESICAKRALMFTDEHGSFQDPYEARRFFKRCANIDLLSILSAEQEIVVRRVFHKRHAWQHARGVITARYVKKVPEDRELEGHKATLSMSELETAAVAVRLMLDVLPVPGGSGGISGG